MKIPNQYKSLEYVHDIEWSDIFSVWRAYEAYQACWREHWIERGFDSWDEWRNNYILPLSPESKEWKIYKIKDLKMIGEFYGVPSRGWIKKCYNGEITKKLGDILDHPMIKDNKKIDAIMKNSPYQTMLTGIVNDGKIVLVEGMHRVCALALMAKDDVKYSGDIVIALAEHKGEISKIGKGSNN